MGGAKKFLYAGPKGNRDAEVEDQLTFNQPKSPRGFGNQHVDLENVWSIKKNVTAGTGITRSDGLTLNASKGYYSRYGGMKEKDEFHPSFGAGNVNANNHMKQDSSNRTWNMAPRGGRPFSYSYGADQPQGQSTSSPMMSPRNVSNSSFGNYSNPANSSSTSHTFRPNSQWF
ncbi:hypothetical protein CHS0354_005991 [Potamilus streckersoni]|uniref:Uncharacterized protein n=1 Tax=Potamilus streckersoni TaxID=2493646 RepID=A0AAE0RP29_9BIVA|nr:hypothetical protein CHS0354_005991 [Potamilus streckersoni]